MNKPDITTLISASGTCPYVALVNQKSYVDSARLSYLALYQFFKLYNIAYN